MAAAPIGATGCPRPPPWYARCSASPSAPCRATVASCLSAVLAVLTKRQSKCLLQHRSGCFERRCSSLTVAPGSPMTQAGSNHLNPTACFSSAGGCSAGPQRRGEPGGRHGWLGPGGGPAGAAGPPAVGLRVSVHLPLRIWNRDSVAMHETPSPSSQLQKTHPRTSASVWHFILVFDLCCDKNLRSPAIELPAHAERRSCSPITPITCCAARPLISDEARNMCAGTAASTTRRRWSSA